MKSSSPPSWHHLSLRCTLSVPSTKHLIVIKGENIIFFLALEVMIGLFELAHVRRTKGQYQP